MKLSEICLMYNINEWEFTSYVRENNLPYTSSIFHGMIIDDKNVDSYVLNFISFKEFIKNEELKQKQIEEIENNRKKKAMANMLITSGFTFDGYRITKYSGYISGDDAMSVDRGYAWQHVSVRDELMSSLSQIRRNALQELKEAAYNLGCNAVIGVDFDYITLDPHTANASGGTTYQPYVFCVTANGNAVVIEEIKE